MNSYIDMNELKRRATHQGWKVELRNGGHVGWTSPDGKLIIAPSTRSDSRGLMDQIKLMEKHGFINEPNKVKGRTGRVSKFVSAFLKDYPDTFFDVATISEKTGLNNAQVGNSLKSLRDNHTGFYMKKEKGKFLYCYSPSIVSDPSTESISSKEEIPLEPVVESQEEEFPELEKMKSVLRSRELPELPSDLIESVSEEGKIEEIKEKSTEIVLASSNLPKKTPLLFEPISTYPKGGLILRDEDGMIWLARKMIPES